MLLCVRTARCFLRFTRQTFSPALLNFRCPGFVVLGCVALCSLCLGAFRCARCAGVSCTVLTALGALRCACGYLLAVLSVPCYAGYAALCLLAAC
jgi:hypothetical protein